MNWTDEYREIVEFYYWEPQHIGRTGGEKRFSGADDMYAHVNKLEVSLNHILNIFFSLYSIERLDCFSIIKEPVTMLSSGELERYQRQQKNATQPDMFFTGTANNFAIELKIQAKSNLAQVKKYIEFNNAISQNSLPLTLIYLTPTNLITKVFTEKFARPQAISTELLRLGYTRIPSFFFVSYADLYLSLEKAATLNPTEERLIGGLLNYLNQRDDLLRLARK